MSQDLAGLTAQDLPVNTEIEVPAERMRLTRVSHGKRPWRTPGGKLGFSHAAVTASMQAGEVKVISLGPVAAV